MAELTAFNESVLSNEGKILVKFGAPWCGPCQAVAPVLESLAADGYAVFDVNTDEDPDSPVKYGIRSVPTFIVFENGEEVQRETGSKTKAQLIELFN